MPFHRLSIGRFTYSVAYAQRCHPGERQCGDAFALLETRGRLLVCVVDGAGHGEGAKQAADAFLSYARQHPAAPIHDLLVGGHGALRKTRGGVASLLAFGAETVEFAGVGNVALRAWTRHPFDAFPTAGMLGVRLPAIRLFSAPIAPGDLAVMYSDGASSPLRFPRAFRSLAVSELSSQLLELNASDRDDCTVALVVVSNREA